MAAILLVDDEEDSLEALGEALKKLVTPEEATIITWSPDGSHTDPYKHFESLIDGVDITLVVTDYDLTKSGSTGLFGYSIVGWCQDRAIPVADFSRKLDKLPKEPDLFEMRIPGPIGVEENAKIIASTYRGFKQVQTKISSEEGLTGNAKSPASVLARVLGVPHHESEFARYSSRIGISSSSLLSRILKTASKDKVPQAEEVNSVLSYMVGHLLINSVLRFPGPIVSTKALAAYVGSSEFESERLARVFTDASYKGPFSELSTYYWRHIVDDVLDQLAEKHDVDLDSADTHGELHRFILELELGSGLAHHDCARCGGRNGGFLCPFTERTVCEKPDCSVASNSWIPQGATLCRIEREFYDEWAPLLGM